MSWAERVLIWEFVSAILTFWGKIFYTTNRTLVTIFFHFPKVQVNYWLCMAGCFQLMEYLIILPLAWWRGLCWVESLKCMDFIAMTGTGVSLLYKEKQEDVLATLLHAELSTLNTEVPCIYNTYEWCHLHVFQVWIFVDSTWTIQCVLTVTLAFTVHMWNLLLGFYHVSFEMKVCYYSSSPCWSNKLGLTDYEYGLYSDKYFPGCCPFL